MVDRVMDMVKRMVRDCGTGMRSMEANMVATRQLKRTALKQVSYNSQVAYYNHMSEVEAAAKTQKVKLHVAALESDRPSAPLRLTSIGGNQRALALADAYCDVPLAGDPLWTAGLPMSVRRSTSSTSMAMAQHPSWARVQSRCRTSTCSR